jgi:hypothetical protein
MFCTDFFVYVWLKQYNGHQSEESKIVKAKSATCKFSEKFKKDRSLNKHKVYQYWLSQTVNVQSV